MLTSLVRALLGAEHAGRRPCALVHVLSPDCPPVMSPADARGATAIVVLGAGWTFIARAAPSYGVPTREGSLRVARSRAGASPPRRQCRSSPTGGTDRPSTPRPALMAHQLRAAGRAGRTTSSRKSKSPNTHDHALLVPPVAEAARHRAVRAGDLAASTSRGRWALFAKVGFDPVPSTSGRVRRARSRFRDVPAVVASRPRLPARA